MFHVREDERPGGKATSGGWFNPPSSPVHRLLVCLTPATRNVHLSLMKEDIVSIFDLCGGTKSVQTAHYPNVPNKQRPSLAYAIVEFYTGVAAAEAVASLNGTVLPAGLGTIQIHRLEPEENPSDRLPIIYETYFGFPAVVTKQLIEHQQQHGSEKQQQQLQQQQLQQQQQQQQINPTQALKQLSALLSSSSQAQSHPPHSLASELGAFGVLPPQPMQQQPSTGPANEVKAGPVFMARLELIELFGSEEFNVTQAVLGDQDRNIHYILDESENKVAISLKGVPVNQAPVAERLHMAVTSASQPHYDRAVEMAEDLLQAVCSQYVQFCLTRRIKVPSNVGFVRHSYVGTQTPDGQGEKYNYLGMRERPRVWLDDVPPHALQQPGAAGGGISKPLGGNAPGGGENQQQGPPPQRSGGGWTGRRPRGGRGGRGGFHDGAW